MTSYEGLVYSIIVMKSNLFSSISEHNSVKIIRNKMSLLNYIELFMRLKSTVLQLT